MKILLFAVAVLMVGCNTSEFKVDPQEIVTPVAPVTCDETLRPYGGGDGTSADPYRICDPEHLVNIELNYSSHYKVFSDLDLSSYASWESIGADNVTNFFTGVLDGNNKTISNLTINTPADPETGLFRHIANGAVVKNLNITNATVSAQNGGILSGSAYGNSLIKNVSVQGNISGTASLGGIVGWTWQMNIEDTSFTGNVTGTGNYVGGIASYFGVDGTTPFVYHITNSSVVGTMTGLSAVSGVVGGGSYNALIEKSFADVTLDVLKVNGSGSGIMASDCGNKVIKTVAVVQYSGDDSVSGTIGTGCVNIIEDNLALGSISSSVTVGGITARTWSTTTINRNISMVQITDTTGSNAYTSALFGLSHTGTVADNFYQNDLGSPADPDGVGLAPAAFLIASFTNFDFSLNWAMASTPWKAFPHPVPKWICGKHGVTCQ